MLKTLLTTAVLSVAASAALADGISVSDPYARSSSPTATTGAAFMVIANETDADDTLIEVRADGVAERIELHNHIADDGGVMRMREVEGGIKAPAQSEVKLQRGGLHVMFMGLEEPFVQGEDFDLTLVFEHAGEVEVTVPVDLERTPDGEGMHGMAHGDTSSEGMSHGDMKMPATESSN